MKYSFILFFAFGVIARLFPLLLIPLIMRIGDDTAVADFMLFVSVSSFCSMFFLFGTQFELTRVFFAARNGVAKNIANALLLIFLLAVVISAFIFAVDLDDIYLMASINGYFTAIVSYVLVYYRVSGSVIKFGVTDVFRVAIQYIVMAILLNFDQFDLKLILLSNIFWILSLILFEVIKSKITIRAAIVSIDFNEFKENVVRGAGILPHSISIYALALLDKLLLDNMATASVLAQYSVGFVFGQTVLLITDSFNKVWGPYAISSLESGAYLRLIRLSFLISLSAILLSPFVGIVVYWVSGVYFPDNYSMSKEVAVLVSLIYVFQSIYFVVFPFLVQSGLVSKIGLITSISAILGAITMYLFASIEYFSYLPLGMFVAFAGQIVGMIIVVRRYRYAN